MKPREGIGPEPREIVKTRVRPVGYTPGAHLEARHQNAIGSEFGTMTRPGPR